MQGSAANPPLSVRFKRLCRHYDLSGFLFVLPAIILLGIFMFYPLLSSFWLSLTEYNIVKPPTFIGLDNFRELYHDPIFHIAFKNTLMYTAVVVPTCIVFPLLLALLVNRTLRGMAFFRSIIYLPVITAMPIAGIMWKILYSQQGFINGFLQWVGLRKGPIGFLSDPDVALLSIIFVTIWKASGYYMMLYLGGLQSIPVELDEAATVDGANVFQRFWNVTLPLLKPSFVLVVIISAIGALKVFGEVYVMTGGGPADSTNTIVYYIYRQAFVFLKMGYASAMGVVLFALLFVFSFAYMRHMERQYTTY
ncbi:MAG: sugar ABC transporter permease [Firmicutes bacterium]|nr:sugar ABC transporter permease [Bacillota bacterium]